MRKRFTVMLDVDVIKKLKEASTLETPTALRKGIQDVLEDFAVTVIETFKGYKNDK